MENYGTKTKTSRNRNVFEYRYGNEFTLSKIGSIMHITAERVRQVADREAYRAFSLYEGGLTPKEIAEKMEVSEVAVRNALASVKGG